MYLHTLCDVFNDLQCRDDSIVGGRIFWIYGLVSLFFTILGVVYLCKGAAYLIPSWIISNLCLWYVVYALSLPYAPFTGKGRLCECVEKSGIRWFWVNLLYLAILVIGVVWCADYQQFGATFRSVAPILIVIGGLLLLGVARTIRGRYDYFSLAFWLLVAFLLLWLVSAFCTLLIDH